MGRKHRHRAPRVLGRVGVGAPAPVHAPRKSLGRKVAFHALCLLGIGVTLGTEALSHGVFRVADWAFLALAVMVEVEDKL